MEAEEVSRRMTRSICCEAAAAAANLEEIFLPIPKLFTFRGKRQRRMKCGRVRQHQGTREPSHRIIFYGKYQIQISITKKPICWLDGISCAISSALNVAQLDNLCSESEGGKSCERRERERERESSLRSFGVWDRVSLSNSVDYLLESANRNGKAFPPQTHHRYLPVQIQFLVKG